MLVEVSDVHMEPIKVVIADDDEGMRLIERRMIEKVEGFELVGEAKDGEELLDMVDRMDTEDKKILLAFLRALISGDSGLVIIT